MKLFNNVKGTMKVLPKVEVNRDTVYVRNNIVAIKLEDADGWQYDEIQYKKDEYTGMLQKQIDDSKSSSDFIGILLVEKDIQVMNLQKNIGTLGEQLVQMDISLMMGGV